MISFFVLGSTTIDSAMYAFWSSDLLGQSIVVLLFLGSIFTWVVMIEKGIALSKAKKSSLEFLRLFRSKQYPLRCFKEGSKNISPVARVYESGALQLMAFYGLPIERADFYGTDHFPIKKLTVEEIAAIETTLNKAISEQLLILEERVSFLGTAVSLAPFMGLFGTVWGIMIAFCSLAILGKASIDALAPGVSGALLTTVVGLVVAIPSLIGNNYLISEIRLLTIYLDNFEEEFLAKIRLENIDSNR